MKLTKWIIAGGISYIATMWIKNFWLNLIASMIVWYGMMKFLDFLLEEPQ